MRGSASTGEARAVSVPIPDEPPVTIARWPERSMASITSAAVEATRKACEFGLSWCWVTCDGPRSGVGT